MWAKWKGKKLNKRGQREGKIMSLGADEEITGKGLSLAKKIEKEGWTTTLSQELWGQKDSKRRGA